jgi:hypothetical protein
MKAVQEVEVSITVKESDLMDSVSAEAAAEIAKHHDQRFLKHLDKAIRKWREKSNKNKRFS